MIWRIGYSLISRSLKGLCSFDKTNLRKIESVQEKLLHIQEQPCCEWKHSEIRCLIYFLFIKLFFDMHHKDEWFVDYQSTFSSKKNYSQECRVSAAPTTSQRNIICKVYTQKNCYKYHSNKFFKRYLCQTLIKIFNHIPVLNSDMFTLCGHTAGLIIILNSKSLSHNSCQKFACKCELQRLNFQILSDSLLGNTLKFSEFVEIIVWQVIPFENPQTHSISGGPYFDQFLWTANA